MKNEHKRGFSLLEVIAVVAIMGVLMALTTTSFLDVTKSFKIAMAGQDVRNAIALARQEATSRNRPVEVRFCRHKDSAPVRFVQLVGYETDGTLRILSRPTKLPEGACIDTDNTFSNGNKLSSLFTSKNAAQGASSSAFISNANPLILLPEFGSSYQLFSFFILPDGTSSLPWSTNQANALPSVTIRGDQNTGIPKNYATVQIDPANSRATLIRP